MSYKIDGKFVSRKTYEAHIKQQQEAAAVSNEEDVFVAEIDAEVEETEKPARVYTVNPLIAATRRLTKAQKALDKARAAVVRQQDVAAAYEEAVIEYEAAAAEVRVLVAE